MNSLRAADGGEVPPVAVVAEAGVGVEELRGEAVAEEGDHRAGGRENVPEGVVLVRGGDGAAFVRVAEDVADFVTEGKTSMKIF